MLALIKDGILLRQVPEESALDYEGLFFVSPARAGWSYDGGFELVTIDPADPVPAGKRVIGSSVAKVGLVWKLVYETVDISAEEIRAEMPDLERWRVNTIIDLTAGLRDKIDSAIDAQPEPARTINRNKLAHVSDFSRADPLFDMIGGDPAIGLTPELIDAMWLQAAAL